MPAGRPERAMRAEILSVGTELLLGQITDTNASWLAGRLADLGIDCLWRSTVGDNLGRATEAFRRALDRGDLVVATGGLGPTEDDLTREAIAAALDETPAVDPQLEADLRAWFGGRGMVMPERNRKQAWLIPSATALANPNGTAPGWLVRRDGRMLVAMPGVPREMTAMWENEVEPLLAGGSPLRSRTLKLLGIGEGSVEEALGELVRSTAPTVATYAKADGVHVRVTDRDADLAARDLRIAEMEAGIRRRLGRYVWGVDGETLGGVIGGALRAQGWRLATAESVTGGEIARALSEADDGWYLTGAVIPGADEARLARAVPGAEVSLIAFATADGAAAVVNTPFGPDRGAVRAGSAAE
ncbi:MAG: CinA family nicotinamide mononucleotide deamidase-related protein, partial [Chloroflexi bacterium]|nr:CinA family nicotinamide mononucleotide deamidase-related protein [Chloroflexota bacterium]